MKDARNAKLRKPISNEKQLLDLAKENLSLKRKMMEEMKEVNKEYTSNMAVLTNTLVGLTSAVTNALSMSGFQAQPPQLLQPTHYLSYSNQSIPSNVQSLGGMFNNNERHNVNSDEDILSNFDNTN